MDLRGMGLGGRGLAESELDRDRWQTCEDRSEPCLLSAVKIMQLAQRLSLHE